MIAVKDEVRNAVLRGCFDVGFSTFYAHINITPSSSHAFFCIA
jgi:hypothetical protein